MKLRAVGEGAKSNKHEWYPTPLCFCINCHLERAGLDLKPPPPHTHTYTVLISHPQPSRLTDSVWGEGIGVKGTDNHAPTPQAGRVTDSDGGGRVRVRV
jgi:hypothetical protein